MSFSRSRSFQRTLYSIVKCLNAQTRPELCEAFTRKTHSSTTALLTNASRSEVSRSRNAFFCVPCRRHTTDPREGGGEHVLTLYKGRWMVPFYVLVRLKVLQLTGFAAFVVPVNAWLSQVRSLFPLCSSHSNAGLHRSETTGVQRVYHDWLCRGFHLVVVLLETIRGRARSEGCQAGCRALQCHGFLGKSNSTSMHALGRTIVSEYRRKSIR